MDFKINNVRPAIIATLIVAWVSIPAEAQSVSGSDLSNVRFQNPVAATHGNSHANSTVKTLLSNFSGPTHAGGECGDSNPDPGEECDDGNLINGDGCSSTCTIESGFDCTAAVAGQDTENILGDGSFELNDGSWTISGWAAGRCNELCAGGNNFASDGEWWIWVGGTGDTNNFGQAEQVLDIPANVINMTFDVESGATACGDSFIGVLIDGAPQWSYEEQGHGECQTTPPYEYEEVDIDLSSFADGQSHSVILYGDYIAAGGGANANWFLDNFRINIPLVPPILPIPSQCTAIVCGDGVLGSTEQCDDANTINGDGCSSACEVEQPHFVCEDPRPPADSGDDILDGGLEDGPPNRFWSQTGVQFDPICSEALCGAALSNSGEFFAWLGGSAMPNLQTLTQTTTISTSATELTFQLLVGICDSANDILTIEIDGTEVYRYDCIASINPYQTQSIPLGGFANGSLHTIQFIANTVASNGGNSNFFVDDISILDNVPLAGTPSVCEELQPACGTIEQFEAWPPAGWTLVNTGVNPADGWGTSENLCGVNNWSSDDPFSNETDGGGIAACADSDATEPDEMETYLCSPALDLSTGIIGPAFSFLANYQTTNVSEADDFLQVLVGTSPPSAINFPSYTPNLQILDHLDNTLDFSEPSNFSASLDAFSGESEVYVCFRYKATFSWFAQVDNAGLRAASCSGAADSDGDGDLDGVDNCINTPNADQRDSNGDGHGNACDADLNNDCLVNGADLGLMRDAFFGALPDADLDGDGNVSFLDLGIMKSLFLKPPGPSAAGNCSP